MGVRHQHELTAALMIEDGGPLALPIQHPLDPRHTGKQFLHPCQIGRVAHVNVADLVIDHGEGPTGGRVQVFPAQVQLQRQ